MKKWSLLCSFPLKRIIAGMMVLCLLLAFSACKKEPVTENGTVLEAGTAEGSPDSKGKGQPESEKAENAGHNHSPAEAPQAVENPVSGYCGNTITSVSYGGEEYSFMGGDSITLTDILINLEYDPDQVCTCETEFPVTTEFGTGYHVNLKKAFVRCDRGQADLTTEQVSKIQGVIDRLGENIE